MSKRLLIDGHLDIGWSAVSFNRDITQPVAQIRAREAEMTDHPSRGRSTVALPEMRQAGVALCLPTLLARARSDARPLARTSLDAATQEIAYGMAHAQLAYYRALAERGEVCFISSKADLESHWQRWERSAWAQKPALQESALTDEQPLPVGLILSMEGADPILHPRHASQWWEAGLRVVSLVHYGIGPYGAGTNALGPLTPLGIELLREMERLEMILDVTHLSDEGFDQALDHFGGPIIATHSNCRALAPHQRQLTDAQILRLVERGAVIGVVTDIWMLYGQWPPHAFNEQGRFITSPELRALVQLEAMAAHIDHICQLAGNSKHVAIGSDLDGGYGTEQSPEDLDTIGDLQALSVLLSNRGFSEADIDRIFHGNWLRFFRTHLPEIPAS